MEKEIVEEISKKYDLKKRLVEELTKVAIFYGETLEEAKNDIKNFI